MSDGWKFYINDYVYDKFNWNISFKVYILDFPGLLTKLGADTGDSRWRLITFLSEDHNSPLRLDKLVSCFPHRLPSFAIWGQKAHSLSLAHLLRSIVAMPVSVSVVTPTNEELSRLGEVAMHLFLSGVLILLPMIWLKRLANILLSLD